MMATLWEASAQPKEITFWGSLTPKNLTQMRGIAPPSFICVYRRCRARSCSDTMVCTLFLSCLCC